jgi:hypothetical protein
LGTFLARTPPQAESRVPQTRSLLGQTVTLQSFCLANELCNRALAARSPGVEGLRPSEKMRLTVRFGHRDIVQVAPSLEASRHNASERRTSCDPGKLTATQVHDFQVWLKTGEVLRLPWPVGPVIRHLWRLAHSRVSLSAWDSLS